jgi:hypothetical protein
LSSGAVCIGAYEITVTATSLLRDAPYLMQVFHCATTALLYHCALIPSPRLPHHLDDL